MPSPLWISPDDRLTPFPDPAASGWPPEGLMAAGADLSPARLLEAYRRGIFPWFAHGDPVLWWSPDPRGVLFPQQFHSSRRLERFRRNCRWRVSADHAFAEVVAGCAAPRGAETGTWIVPEMERAYQRLHALGAAHSVEVWSDEGALIGGLYGVSVGAVFCAESMFSGRSQASKIALWALSAQWRRWGGNLIDCQFLTPHLASLGARTVTRRDYLARLADALSQPFAHPAGRWRLDADIAALEAATLG